MSETNEYKETMGILYPITITVTGARGIGKSTIAKTVKELLEQTGLKTLSKIDGPDGGDVVRVVSPLTQVSSKGLKWTK